MAIQTLYPSISPSLSLDFANVKALDPRITFTRTTTATYYDGKTTAKAEENLLLQSQTFNTTWAVSQTSVTANTEAAPDGTTTAETITDNAVNAPHIVQQGISPQANTEYVFSCFLKEGTNTHAYLSIRDTGTAQRYFCADFDLNGGTVRTSTAGSSGTLTSATITSVGNGWYRCVIVGQVSVAFSMFATIGLSDGSSSFSTFGSISYAGASDTIYAWGAQLEQRSAVTAYTPTTTQPITNYIPALQTAASGVARFDHRPLTGESLGLLVEEQRTNVLLRSEEFSNATWGKTRLSVTADSIVAPNGTLTGDQLVENTDNDTHLIDQGSLSFTSGTSYTVSVYAKDNGRFLQLTFGTGAFSSAPFANFNLSTGVVSASGGSGTATITAVGNGWYRCTLTATASATATASFFMLLSNSGTSARFVTGYTGDGYKGVFLWGAQLEAGAFPTSYIATTSATVTRNADAASMTGTNFSSWYRADEGTLYGDVKLIATTATGPVAFGISDGSTANALYGGQTLPTQVRPLGVRANSTDQAFPSVSVTVAPGYEYKFSGAYKFNDIAGAINGVAATTDTNALVPVVNQARIGGVVGATQPLNGTIKKLAFYPARLTDAQLQALTS